MAVTETIFCGLDTDKLYTASGQFTTTIRESISILAVDSGVEDISWDGTNIPWCGSAADKLYLQSGKFTSTIKTSLAVAAIDDNPISIDADKNGNTPWGVFTGIPRSIFLQSGQFTSTVKTSVSITGLTVPHGLSFDGTDTFAGDLTSDKLFKVSGQYTTTVKESLSIVAIDDRFLGGVFDGTNVPWAADTNNKFILQSGYFSSTVKTSLSSAAIDTVIKGLDVDDYLARQGVDTSPPQPPPGGGGRPSVMASRGRILTARDDRDLRKRIERELSQVEEIKIDTAAMSSALDIIFREVSQEKAAEKARQEDRITQITRETIRFEHQQKGIKEQLKAVEQLRGDVSKGMQDLEALIALLLARLL